MGGAMWATGYIAEEDRIPILKVFTPVLKYGQVNRDFSESDMSYDTVQYKICGNVEGGLHRTLWSLAGGNHI